MIEAPSTQLTTRLATPLSMTLPTATQAVNITTEDLSRPIARADINGYLFLIHETESNASGNTINITTGIDNSIASGINSSIASITTKRFP
mmetsp:Transcript_19965/g.41314  ORF Transcript_19965/g.41314 Transcript_19965/m.41314 type:complete len:91 (+) Transcript_19965:1686-1958(+)|eukprot:CAMPEP_0201136312 /NCGR_PEP_ID=MMETSP0850-20130426/54817_1 /ASSEMBLY_ACC=CAM_ASM_000622 /TAXON_ID=183588 /ORGANISM="Pseudo-nitzschia fraudulenta, Strain WWA7" /LENGTH=90 /DNA_ID=CAMNT_0047407605 /DNA_START=1204 /DNA_END=1476 /DNA_ORIENTATION=+